MNSRLLAVSDAVVAALNAGTFSQPFMAVRTYLPQFELRELATLKVVVAPREETREQLTRAKMQFVFGVDIGVLKKPANLEAADLDPLMNLVDEIATHFNGNALPGVTGATCTTVKPDPVYAPEHLEKFRQFTSVLALTVKVLP